MTLTRIVRALVALALASSLIGCSNAYTSTVVRSDGSTMEALPSCLTTDASGTTSLRGTNLGDGVPVSDVEAIRSHAGVEVLVAGTVAVLAGTGLIVWYVADNPNSKTAWRVALGGATAGIGLVNAIVGAALWNRSAGALSRDCHPRAGIPR